MKFTLILLFVVVLSVDSRNTVSSVSKDGQLTLEKLLGVGQWREERQKRDVSQLNIPQLTIAANLPNETVCPWTYRTDSDVNRRPVDLVEAVCIQPTGTDDVCLRVFYFIPVQVKMTSPDGAVTWMDKSEKKVVACALARPLLAIEIDDEDSAAVRD